MLSVVSGVNITTQMHLSGRSHATAFKDIAQGDGSRVLYITVSDVSWNASEVALSLIEQATGLLFSEVMALHETWWNAYYPASFVTFTDSILESFYWINMYKLASGTRADRIVYDLMGPWFIGMV